MPEISRDEVAHLATLARIDLSDAELDAISVVAMEIEEAAAKVKAEGVAKLPADEAWDGWRGVIPVRQMLGAPEPMEPGSLPPSDVVLYTGGGALDAALTAAAQA